MDNNCIGDRVKAMRTKLDMSQAELAKRIGFARGSILSIENGGTKPSLEAAMNLSKHLGVSIDWLVGNTEYLDGEIELRVELTKIKGKMSEIRNLSANINVCCGTTV